MNESAPPDAWKTCYQELAPKLLLFARQWVHEPADAEDVVQTAFVKFWRKQPDAQRQHFPLLYAAVRTTALDFLRSNGRRALRENESSTEILRDDTSFFDTSVQQREDAALLEGALRELPAEQREVLVLRVWSGLTFAEIATTLDESINTVAARHRYALEALRRHLKPYAHERL